jgi:DNA-directed RNA polymerase subunit RPC12/RpoP
MSKGPEFRFTNYYKCPKCKATWNDCWDSQCNDECPKCGAKDIQPYRSTDYRGINGTLWLKDNIQFPRLIAELNAVGAFTPKVIADLCKVMDLEPREVMDLRDRAENEFARIKEKMFK